MNRYTIHWIDEFMWSYTVTSQLSMNNYMYVTVYVMSTCGNTCTCTYHCFYQKTYIFLYFHDMFWCALVEPWRVVSKRKVHLLLTDFTLYVYVLPLVHNMNTVVYIITKENLKHLRAISNLHHWKYNEVPVINVKTLNNSNSYMHALST